MLLAFFPAVLLAAGARVAWWLRGGAAGLAVLLAGLALLTVSRGAVYATPIVLLILFAVIPGRLRTLLALVPVGVAVALAASSILHVGDVVDARGDVGGAVDQALLRLLGGALVAAGVTALAAWPGWRRTLGATAARRLELGLRVLVTGVLVVAVVGGALAVGDPVDRARSAWSSFKGGYEDNAVGENRLVSGLGSSRYDFYRVGLRSFRDYPLAGIGVDGFYQDYLREGRSSETPRYPHSIEVRTLVQTGLVGAALMLGFVLAAGAAALRAMRTGGALHRTVAGGAAIGATYWFVHGSLDWFWEWAGLGVPTFALVGLACSLAPRAPGTPTLPRGAWRIGVVVAALVVSVPLLSLWTAERERVRAASEFATAPLTAYDRLDRAAALNPFSAAPATLEGSIAVRFGDLPRADAAFGRALARVPDDQYATLERGAVASARGDRRRALELLRRAVALAPRDVLAREALDVAREGGSIDVAELNRRILRSAQAFGA